MYSGSPPAISHHNLNDFILGLKKLQKKLDHKKLYRVEYTNKKGNELVAHISGIEPK